MSHAPVVESRDGSHQITIDGILQMTVQENGIVTIDLAGKHLEVVRDMPNVRLTVRPDARFAYMAPELLKDKGFVAEVLAHHSPEVY